MISAMIRFNMYREEVSNENMIIRARKSCLE